MRDFDLNAPDAIHLATAELLHIPILETTDSDLLKLDDHAGIDNTLDNSAAYIAGWLKALKGDNKLAITAASAAQRAADYILGE